MRTVKLGAMHRALHKARNQSDFQSAESEELIMSDEFPSIEVEELELLYSHELAEMLMWF